MVLLYIAALGDARVHTLCFAAYQRRCWRCRGDMTHYVVWRQPHGFLPMLARRWPGLSRLRVRKSFGVRTNSRGPNSDFMFFDRDQDAMCVSATNLHQPDCRCSPRRCLSTHNSDRCHWLRSTAPRRPRLCRNSIWSPSQFPYQRETYMHVR